MPRGVKVQVLLPAPRRSKVRFAPTYFFNKNKSSARFLAPPFSQKGTLRYHLFAISRPLPCSSSFAKRHATLPPFCDFLPASLPLLSNRNPLPLGFRFVAFARGDFFTKVTVRFKRCGSLFAEKPAWLACSLASALTTASCRYHFSAILCASRT